MVPGILDLTKAIEHISRAVVLPNRQPTRVASVRAVRMGAPMCDKCAKLDKKIEHYETMLVSIGDRVTVERLMALVGELQAQKAALHPQQKQQ
jgi:hypothetical protein